MKRPLRWLAALFVLLLLLPLAAMAQEQGLEIDIVGGNAAAAADRGGADALPGLAARAGDRRRRA